MGGVILLLMITVVLCIVILCVRRRHRKEIPVDDKVFYNTSKLNTDVPVEYNPSYGVTKKDNNIQEIQLFLLLLTQYTMSENAECCNLLELYQLNNFKELIQYC